MQKKYILLLLLFTGYIDSFFTSTPESQVARHMFYKHVGVLPSSFNGKQMHAFLQDIKKESSTRGIPEALIISEISYLIAEKFNYWEKIRNDSSKDYDDGMPFLVATACIATLTFLYVVYEKQNYAHHQAQVKLLSATAPQELASIEQELQSLGADWIDLKKDLPEPIYTIFSLVHSVSARGPVHKKIEIEDLLKKAKLVHDNLNSAKWNLKNDDFTAGLIMGIAYGLPCGIVGACAYYAKSYCKKYYFIMEELQKYQQCLIVTAEIERRKTK